MRDRRRGRRTGGPAGEGLDLARELANAYAQRGALAPVAAATFERIDKARLEALLAGVAGVAPPLTAPLSVDGLALWLQRLQADDAQVTTLLNHVLAADTAG